MMRFIVYVPNDASLRTALISGTFLAGHLGVRKAIAALSQHYLWPVMDEDVEQHVCACHECHLIKATVQPRPEIHPLPVPERSFKRMSLNWVDRCFPQSS
jgi:Integrase zinc binding domain